MPRRRAGALLPLEEDILEIGLGRAGADTWFYGFGLAEELAGDESGRHALLGHGTLYKALDRLEEAGLLESRWESVVPSEVGRPRRREYRVTGLAAAALERSRALRDGSDAAPRWRTA